MGLPSRIVRRAGRILFLVLLIVLAASPIPILPFVVKKSWLRRRREVASQILPR